MKAIILIGGFGTRLRPLTCSTPKPLLPVLNKPFSLYQIELLKKYGIKDIILCMAYLPSEFKKYFGDGKKFGIKILYAIEKTPLGTGGAIKNAEKFVNGSVIIFNGDVLTEINLNKFIQFHKKKKSKATISLVSVPDPTSFGLVETAKNGRVLQFLEKPSLNQITCDTVNAGTYIFEPEIFKEMPSNVIYSVERELFPTLLNKKIPFYGYAYSTCWIDFGTTEKYLQIHSNLMNQMKKNIIGKNSKIAKSVRIFGHLVVGDNAKISEKTTTSGNVCLGNGVRIGEGCFLSDCVILDKTVIEEGVRIEKSVVGKNCVVEKHSHLMAGCVIGDKTVVRMYSKL
ncbi:MAG: NDP-sugar synthase [Elusimicrobiota bacterium]